MEQAELQPEVLDQGGHPPVVAPTVQTISTSAEEDQEQFAQAAEKAFSEDESTPAPALDSLSTELLREFDEAVRLRQKHEQRWLTDLRQYRGIYDAATLAKLANRSQSFVRRTRVKVKTTDSRIMDLLFPAGSEKNWSCDSTPVPSVSDELRKKVEQQLANASGQPPAKDAIDKAILEMCKQAAKGMSKVIEDQLVETRYKDVAKKTVHSGNLYGTGIIKGPLVERKVRTRFVQNGDKWQAKDEEYTVPFVDFVPLWRFYPDMNSTELEQCRYVFERHTMSKHEMVALTRRRSFNGQKIRDHLLAHPRGDVRHRDFDQELKSLGEREAAQTVDAHQYEVLERWGWIDGSMLAQAGVTVPPDRLHESFFSNIWLLPNGTVIKAALQPINGVTWPYHIYYFDKDETSIFGEGLASIMRDDQEMLNASVRMLLDNGALTSGPILEIVRGLLQGTDKPEEIRPFKAYFRKAEDLDKGPAVRPIKIESNLEFLLKMAAMFEENSDEVTAIPRYTSGENVTAGAAGTASGMSMLMGQANIVIKDLVTNWDEGVTRTFLQALYRWNMQFSQDNSIKGDFDVKARGTASLIAKEVRAQQINQFAQLTANPEDAPYIKRDRLNQLRAEALEMTDVVKTEDELKAERESEEGQRMAEMQRKMQEAQLAEQIAKADKLAAEAQVAKTKVDEMLANIEKILDERVSIRVETIFAGLQAGGVATRDPLTAPAGDEILRSAGYTDLTPDPSIAQLNGPPVQPNQATQRVMARGETFAQDPRAPGTVQPQVPDAGPGQADGAVAMPDANTGQRAGIETTEIEA
jgi:hypothetical protein